MNKFVELTHVAAAPADVPVAADRNRAVGDLRAFVTLLVLAHHSVIAYAPGMPAAGAFDRPPYLWAAFPVEDPHTFSGWSLLLGFNDMFFMALMFFISGLFVPASLGRKGPAGFLRDRITRLGATFIGAALIIAPLAYYPAYLLSGAEPGFVAYARTWLALPHWNSGPAWFLGVLMALAVAAALVQALAPGAFAALGRLAAGADRRPLRFFLGLSLASAAVYIPACMAFNAMAWFHVGPFAVQASRIGHYPLYFFAGVAVGVYGLDRGLLAAGGELARRWKAWTGLAAVAFVGASAVVIAAYAAKDQPPLFWNTVGGLGFAVSCAASCFMLLAIFRRFAGRASAVWTSLSDNAFGMYLVHYAFASWLQLALLPADLPGALKGVMVFASVAALSWLTAMGLRRIPGAGRIL